MLVEIIIKYIRPDCYGNILYVLLLGIDICYMVIRCLKHRDALEEELSLGFRHYGEGEEVQACVTFVTL